MTFLSEAEAQAWVQFAAAALSKLSVEGGEPAHDPILAHWCAKEADELLQWYRARRKALDAPRGPFPEVPR